MTNPANNRLHYKDHMKDFEGFGNAGQMGKSLAQVRSPAKKMKERGETRVWVGAGSQYPNPSRTHAHAGFDLSLASQDTYKPAEVQTTTTFRKGRMDLFGTGYGMN